MKLIIQIILILVSITSFGQAQKTTTIILSAYDCRNKEAYSWRLDTIRFYKECEDTVIFKVITQNYREFPIKLDSIPVAEYKVTYRNNFGQLVFKQISLADQKTNSVVLCPDVLLDYPQNTIAKLQDRDTISINFHSQGCYYSTVSRILITKKEEKYVARLYYVDWAYVMRERKTIIQYRGDSLLKTVTLTERNIADFIRFENELNFVNEGGCTTTDWYDVKGKYLNKTATDGSCRWDGFYYLRKSFFSDKE
jgi:hypothetical protein